MNRHKLIILVVVLLCCLLAVGGALAQGAAVINWEVIGSGGGSVSGDVGIVVNGTLGQPIVGPVSFDSTSLGVGYWYGARAEYRLYLPLVLRNA